MGKNGKRFKYRGQARARGKDKYLTLIRRQQRLVKQLQRDVKDVLKAGL